jgi:hypothetical protein
MESSAAENLGKVDNMNCTLSFLNLTLWATADDRQAEVS